MTATLRPGRLYVGTSDGGALAVFPLQVALDDLARALRAVERASTAAELADRQAAALDAARDVAAAWGP